MEIFSLASSYIDIIKYQIEAGLNNKQNQTALGIALAILATFGSYLIYKKLINKRIKQLSSTPVITQTPQPPASPSETTQPSPLPTTPSSPRSVPQTSDSTPSPTPDPLQSTPVSVEPTPPPVATPVRPGVLPPGFQTPDQGQELPRFVPASDPNITPINVQIPPPFTLEGDLHETETGLNGRGKIIYSDGDIWEGEFTHGELNGQGVAVVKGIKYEGEFVSDILYGEGKITFPNGMIIEGTFEKNILKNGKITFPNRTVYEGAFARGKLNGKGKITRTNGEILSGIFIDDQLNGKGTITRANGDIFSGTFVDNELNGKGKIIRHNVMFDGKHVKLVEEGMFADGQLHGFGKRSYYELGEQGQLISERHGIFKHGEFDHLVRERANTMPASSRARPQPVDETTIATVAQRLNFDEEAKANVEKKLDS